MFFSPSPEPELLPLLHDADSFLLYIVQKTPKRVHLVQVVRYPQNHNGEGVVENFRILDEQTKKAIIGAINRRYVGRMVQA